VRVYGAACSAKKGGGSFNWRMKWTVKLPMKFPRLHLQMWDKDITKFSDCIAESRPIDLSKLFNSALRTGVRRKCSPW
jgi:hypothetical protein